MRGLLGIVEPYVRQPFFYSDQFDFGMEYRGCARSWDSVVFRGDVRGRRFIAFWLERGRVVAAMNVNIWDVGEPISGLIRSRSVVTAEQLQDPSIGLDKLIVRPAALATTPDPEESAP